MSEKNYESGSYKNESYTFNWSDEKNAAMEMASENLKSENSASKYKPSADYRDSIFTRPEQREGRSEAESFTWPDSAGKGYFYDFPADDDYVYSPLSDYSFISQGKKNEEKKAASVADGLNNYNRRSSQNSVKSSSQSGTKRPPASVNKGYSEQNKKIPPQNLNGKSKQKSANTRNQQVKKNTQKSNKNQKSAQNIGTNSVKRRSATMNGGAKGKSEVRKKRTPDSTPERIAREKQLRQRQQIEKNNKRFEKARSEGKSDDELRREQSRKKNRTKKFNAVLCVAGVVALIGIGFFVFCMAHGFPIANIIVEGAETYSETEILNAGGISAGENMLKIRQKKTNEAISVQLPYIDSVEVDWQLPDTLRLVITETTDKLLIVNGNKYICVDDKGKVISDIKKKVKGSQYKIEGFEEQEYELGKPFAPDSDNGNKKRYEIVKKIISALEKVGITNCSTIDITDFDFITLKCGKSIKIYVNENTDFASRLSLVAERLTQNPIGGSGSYYFDIRYDNQIVLKDGELER